LLPAHTDPGGVAELVKGLDEAAARAKLESRVLDAVAPGTTASRWPFGPPRGDRRQALGRQLEDVDALVVHGVFSPDAARVRRWVRADFPGVRLAGFPHDGYDTGLFERRRLRKKAYFALVERPALRACDVIITTAPSHELWLRRRGVPTPVVTAPAGLAPHEHEAARRIRALRPTASSSGQLRLLQLGRWDILEKGLDLAVAAVRSRLDGEVSLRLVGPGEGRERDVRRLIHGVPGIEAVGYVPDVWTELATADLLLAPSRKEGFGLAPLQALVCGVPVLLSSRAGLAEYVGAADGALVIDPDDAGVQAGLQQAITALPELRRAAEEFAEKRAASFTTDGLLAAIVRGLQVH
jgi:glycosyltransferase involved in cell wall biosynthesis